MPKIQVQIVTFNSKDSLTSCLDALMVQSLLPDRVMIIDNGSIDQTRQIIEVYQKQFLDKNIPYIYYFLSSNTGYASAHNVGIRTAYEQNIDYVCTLNPDVRLEIDYLKYAVMDFLINKTVGGVTGKLTRPHEEAQDTLRIDSTGLQMKAFFHARDRGQDQYDLGQYEEPTYIWGICGAAAVYRTEMLQQLAYKGQYFDESFFVYKEDVDLCWRGNERGWKFYYDPRATAWHNRGWQKTSTPSEQARIHSFANQVALLIKHVPRPSLILIITLLVEVIRFVDISLRFPIVSKGIMKKIRMEWANTWAWRKGVHD
ncbi:glycosyltransferase family 2 protein [Alicyclobacillus tolerans]|uniref:glycosyltransferase family 2 protein n=1 Tax=Alicyclobacillus tolerans TaxID=90970 RepID=UPI001F49183F|nr:glycosyltransferase family 2 protein [Alicyclobacillus tolerans]MCF8567857.1 glycosyltransferase family 2 protein [Alicyclobacillus tolerans]